MVVLPAVLTKVPASQVRHRAHRGAFAVALKLPLTHGVQARSAAAPPSAATDCPATHAVLATHAVAGEPS